MDKIIELIQTRLEFMIDEYKKKILITPSWQLDNVLAYEVRVKNMEEKIHYLVENYKNNNPLYLLLQQDLKLIEEKKGKVFIENLKAINIDSRFLEGMGLKENQIDEYFKFTDEIIKTLL